MADPARAFAVMDHIVDTRPARGDATLMPGGQAFISETRAAALAAALRGSPLKVGIVEARPPSRPAGWDARIYAISPANVDFLTAIGIWQHLDPARMAPVYDMEIHGDAVEVDI